MDTCRWSHRWLGCFDVVQLNQDERARKRFDGQVFVPREAVKLPVGTQVDVVLPSRDGATPKRSPTADEDAEWATIRQEIAASEPAFATVEEAMRHSRKRSGRPPSTSRLS